MEPKRLRRRALRTLTVRLPLALFALFTLFPVYWVFRTSLMDESDIVKVPLVYIPYPLTANNFSIAWSSLNLAQLFLNSVVVAAGACMLGLLFTIFSAYGFSRFQFRGKAAMMLLIAATQMLPSVAVMIPYYIVFGKLGLVDSRLGLVILEAIGTIPFSTLILMQFFSQIPRSMDEAALIDGANRVQALLLVIAPLVLPGAVAVTIFNFIASWNSLIFPIIMINSPEKMTLPPALLTLRDQFIFGWGLHAAGAVMLLVPAIALFTFVQKYLISGLTSGAVKG